MRWQSHPYNPPDMISNEPWDLVAQVQRGDPTATDLALDYLEADPWAFRTGYMKERLLRGLGRAPLSSSQRVPVGRILLHNVDVGARMEFPEVCRLAHRVDVRRFAIRL